MQTQQLQGRIKKHRGSGCTTMRETKGKSEDHTKVVERSETGRVNKDTRLRPMEEREGDESIGNREERVERRRDAGNRIQTSPERRDSQ